MTVNGRDKTVSLGSPQLVQFVDQPTVPRLALNMTEAAEALGLSLDTFSERVQPTLRIAQVGRRKLVDVRELQRWLDENSHLLEDAAAVSCG